jgi:hypothetical protein
MDPNEAKTRAQSLINVIETMYETKIVNLGDVIDRITEITVDEERILAICSTLNSWVAMNPEVQGREIIMPVEIVDKAAERV